MWIAKSAKVFDSAYIHGPAIIGKEAEVRHCAFIRGNAIVGEGAVVGNSTELKNVILFNKVQVPHYNYVGDSILGYKAHMGAGSITSNVKSDKKLFLRDPLEAQPHDPDVKALLRIAVVYDIPIANNLATADFMLQSRYMEEPYQRKVENFDKIFCVLVFFC